MAITVNERRDWIGLGERRFASYRLCLVPSLTFLQEVSSFHRLVASADPRTESASQHQSRLALKKAADYWGARLTSSRPGEFMGRRRPTFPTGAKCDNPNPGMAIT
ncbi:hypothetical protein R1flu_028347 [Riccia fluitans]|uniref:Uncharacterized protein n=1 Tax=Riccia fluitans TaxID=41844 RepID=A0ABD1XLE7_9MARC